MKKTKFILILSCIITTVLSGCFGGRVASSSNRGGEVVGVSGKGFVEPTPYGMTMIKRGFLKMGLQKEDSLWGRHNTVKAISGCAIQYLELALPTHLMEVMRHI